VGASGKTPSEFAELLRQVQRCRVCPSIAPYRKFPTASRGTPKYRLMIVGEAPGRVSLEHGRAFSNPRNLTIRRAFARAVAPLVADLEQVFYLTDVVKCWPAKGSKANRSPTGPEVRTCANRFLRREIELIKPRLVMTFGALAARAVIGTNVILSDIHPRPIDLADGVKVVPLVHPSTVNIAGMRRVGIGSLPEYEEVLAELLRAHLPADVLLAVAGRP